MAYRGMEIDDEYADSTEFGNPYVKLYFDFDTEAEARRFAELCEEKDLFSIGIEMLAEQAGHVGR